MDLKSVDEEIRRIVAKDFSDRKIKLEEMDPLAFLRANYAGSLAQYEAELARETREVKRRFLSDAIADLKERRKLRDEVEARLSPASRTRLAVFDEALKGTERTHALASQVAAESRKVYLKLYDVELKQRPGKSNPCRDFVL